MPSTNVRSKGQWSLFVCILALAAWFRIVAVEDTVIDHPIRNDAAQYYLSAYNLVFYGIYTKSPARLKDPGAPLSPDSYRYPGLPLVIAVFMKDWPNHQKIMHHIQMVNVVVGVAAVGLVFFAASLALPAWAAFGATLLTAISPHLISFTVYVLTEPISALLIALLMVVVAASARRAGQVPSWHTFIGIGIVIGMLTMFRPIYIALAPAIILALPWREVSRKTIIGVLFGAALVVAPWYVRNAISVSDGSDRSLLATTMLDGAYPGYMLNGNPETFPYPRLVDPRASTLTSDTRSVVEEIGRRFAADPLEMAFWYGIGKVRFLWQWSNVDGMGDVFIYPVTATPFETNGTFVFVHAVMEALHWVLVALGAVGAVAVWLPVARNLLHDRGLLGLRAASVILIYTTLALIPFVMVTRYAVPTFPALYLLAMVPPALAAAAYYRRREHRR